MIAILILIAVFYLLPAIIAYRWNRIAFGPKGMYSFTEPGKDEIAEVIVPFYNIASAIITFEESPYENPDPSHNYERLARKFFLLKPNPDDGTV
jgi:hypothetical protein